MKTTISKKLTLLIISFVLNTTIISFSHARYNMLAVPSSKESNLSASDPDLNGNKWLRKLLPADRWESGKTRKKTSAYPDELTTVNRMSWDSAQALKDTDSLVIQGRSVMEAWQEKYMGVFAKEVTKRGGRILELGFGMGLSASAIQKYDIEEHVIVEPNIVVFRKLQEFAKTAPHKVVPILGTWQEVLEDKSIFADGSFDGIFFDASPFDERELHFRQFDFGKQAYRLLKQGGIYTYCNLSSLGRVKDFYDDWEDLFKETQLPHLIVCGFSNISFKLVDVNPIKGYPKYQHKQAIVPILVKDGTTTTLSTISPKIIHEIVSAP